MRIKVKTLRTLVFTGILAVGAIFAGGLITKKVSNHIAYGEGEKECCCGDIVFSESSETPSTQGTPSNIGAVCSTTTGESALTISDFTLSDFTNAYYKAATDKSPSKAPIKIGGKSSSAAGSFKITLLNGYTCDYAIVYAKRFNSSETSTLKVNDVALALSNDSDYKPYVFDITDSDELLVSNNSATSTSRLCISKIVFKLYK